MPDDEEGGVWFEALWEIVVTIIGGVALALVLGGGGYLYNKRWRQKSDDDGKAKRMGEKPHF